jgi:hypothetical protein
MNRIALPVSQQHVVMRPPAGREELLLLEAPVLDVAIAMTLLGNISARADGSALEWAALPAADIDAAILRVRQIVFGNLIRSDITCPDAQCGKRIDVAFSIDDFLAHHAPRAPRGVTSAEEPGWFVLPDVPASFRVPTGADLLAVGAEPVPAKALIHRCVRPAALRAPAIRRIERALDSMAPSLAQDLAARCAECAVRVPVHFDARSFVLRELRDQATFVFEDTHLLASYYHWPEAEILSLPRHRRVQYAEMLRQAAEAL